LSFAQAFDPEKEFYRLADEVNYFLTNKDYQSAIPPLERMLELNPGNQDVINNLFSVYGRQTNAHLAENDYQTAITLSERMLELIPEDPQVIAMLSRLYFHSGYQYYLARDYDRAIHAYSRLLEIDPEKIEARYNLSACYLDRGKLNIANEALFEDALEDLSMSIMINPDNKDAGVFNELHDLYEDMLLTIKLDEIAHRRLNAKLAGVYYFLAINYARQKEFISAADMAKKAAYFDYTIIKKIEQNPELSFLNNDAFWELLSGNYTAIQNCFGAMETMNKNISEYRSPDKIKIYTDTISRLRALPENISFLAYMPMPELLSELHNAGNYGLGLNYAVDLLRFEAEFLGEKDPFIVHDYNYAGIMNIYIDKHDAAIPFLTKAIELLTSFSGEYAGMLSALYENLGIAYSEKGDYNLAAAYFQHSLTIQAGEKSHDKKAIANTYFNIGNSYSAQSNYRKALENYQTALNTLKEMPGFSDSNEPLIGKVYFALGQSYYRDKTGGDSQGLDYLNSAESFYVTHYGRFHPDLAGVYIIMGNLHFKEYNYDSAIPAFMKALILTTRVYGSNASLTFQINERLGDCYFLSKQFDKALPYYEKTLEYFSSNHSYNNRLYWHLAEMIYLLYDYLEDINPYYFNRRLIDVAKRNVSYGIQEIERIRSTLGSRGHELMLESLFLYYAGVDFEHLYGSDEKAFEYSEALRSRSFLEQMGTETALRLPGISDADSRRVRELSLRIEEARNLLNSYEQENKTPDGEYAETGIELKRLEDELKLTDEKLASVSRYKELRNPKPKSIGEAKQWCGDDRVVLEYVIWDDSVDYAYANENSRPAINSYCLVLTKDGVTAVRLDPAFDYPGTVNALRGKIFHTNEKGKIDLLGESAFEAERNALYNALIAPVLPHIPGGVKNIVIVPDGALAFLPFDILRGNKDDPDFGETCRLSLSPSVSVSMLASETAVLSDEPFLGFGGALYNGYYGVFDDGSPMLWRPLDSSAMELTSIKRHFTQSPLVFTGREVSEARVKAMSADGSLSNYSIIHFACHGYFNQREPAKSGLLLSEISGRISTGEDGNLSIEEVALLRLNARMALLSACSTGMGKVNRGDGMVGLARAFMTAGTRNVGVSLWEIDDRVTMVFMTRLYRYVREEGMSFREAYYRTRNGFREDSRYAHPYYWAAFTMYE
jgi:CHAT domain-containing protein/tetratricopeptide (TPR) repeat protein